MPALFPTRAHFSSSAAISARNSAGVPPDGSAPCAAICSRTFVSANAARRSRERRSIASAGEPPVANTPYQVHIS